MTAASHALTHRPEANGNGVVRDRLMWSLVYAFVAALGGVGSGSLVAHSGNERQSAQEVSVQAELAAIKTEVAVIKNESAGVKRQLDRMEHQLDLLISERRRP